jgi:hypothetical protein
MTSHIQRARNNSDSHRDCTSEALYLLENEEHILDLISLGAPLSVIPNSLRAAIEVQISTVAPPRSPCGKRVARS